MKKRVLRAPLNEPWDLISLHKKELNSRPYSYYGVYVVLYVGDVIRIRRIREYRGGRRERSRSIPYMGRKRPCKVGTLYHVMVTSLSTAYPHSTHKVKNIDGITCISRACILPVYPHRWALFSFFTSDPGPPRQTWVDGRKCRALGVDSA